MCGAWQERVEWETMRRRVFAFLSLLSLLLCVATAVLWVRSAFVYNSITAEWSDHVKLKVQGPEVFIRVNKARFDAAGPLRNAKVSVVKAGKDLAVPGAVFVRYHSIARSNDGVVHVLVRHWELWLSYWLIILASLLLPATYILTAFHTGKHPYPSCPSCGYNITGNTSGTCPECGSPVPQASRQFEQSLVPAQSPLRSPLR